MNIHKLLSEAGAGVYAWTVPDQEAILLIQSIQAIGCGDDLKHHNSTRIHATLMHSPEVPTEFPEFSGGRAQILGAKVLGPDDDKVLVLTLKSDDIEAYARKAHAAGAIYTYSPYVPHITLGKILGDPQEVCDRLNRAFIEAGLEDVSIGLGPAFYSFLET